MKKILLLFACLGIIFQANLNAQTLMHSYTFEDGTYDVANKVIYDQVGTANGTINGDGFSF